MNTRETLRADLRRAVQRAFDNDDDVIYDVAAETSQIVDNVRDMRWFWNAVARELTVRTKKYAPLQTGVLPI